MGNSPPVFWGGDPIDLRLMSGLIYNYIGDKHREIHISHF